MNSINLAYVNAKDKKNKIIICTYIDELKKIQSENIYYNTYGNGYKYWIGLSNNTIIGATSVESIDKGIQMDIPNAIDKYIYSSAVLDPYVNEKKVINSVNIEWEFEAIDELDNLKEFLNSTYNHMACLVISNAEQAFKEQYNVNLKQANYSKGNEFYEKRINRMVIGYSIIALDMLTNDPMLYSVQWYDYNSLKYMKENIDKFIQISDYMVVVE